MFKAEIIDFLMWGILLGALLMYVVGKKVKGYRTKKVLKKARTAEKKAVVFLERHGYHVLAVQLRETVTIYVDNKPYDCPIRADLLVRKGFRRYIVEVKTGGQTEATLPNVRRQLLEYYLVYRPSGVLLLDMEKEKLKKVRFTCTGARFDGIGWFLAALAAGALLGYGLGRFWG